MHGEFGWYELMTTDVESAKAFYGAVVGWTAEPQGPTYTVLKAGGHGVAGMMALTPEQLAGGARPGWIGYIVSDDVDASVAALFDAGGRVHRPPADVPGMLRFSVVADPQGVVFVIFTPDPRMGNPPRPEPGSPGTFGWRELISPDWEAAWPFYAGLFGWKKAWAMDMGPLGTYQTFGTLGGDEIGDIGGMMDTPPGAPAPGWWAYYIHVDGVRAAVERVRQAGGVIVQDAQPVPGGGWIAQGTDPQGAWFSLVSTTE